jgi:hypothetical protein
VSVLALLFGSHSKSCVHWFLLPAIACGILAGVDIVRWLRGELDLFDPRTAVACLAFYGFFLAPLLHVLWNTFGEGDLALYGDWRTWLGAMACLNASGLLVYRVAQNWAFKATQPSRVAWQIDHKKFYPIFAVALASSAAGLTTFLWQLHGISGLIEAFEENQEAFVGKGWLLVFAWPLAVLSFIIMAFILADRQRNARGHLAAGMLLLSVAGIGHFVVLGWYGSRAATVAALFWMAGILHYRFRKFPPTMMAVGVTLLIGFAYFYGFYKERGRRGLEVLRAPAMWLQPNGYERDFKYLLLGDLARADSNALILHNLVKEPGDYRYRWGLTYAGALSILIPRYFWADRPYFRVDAGGEALWGKSAQQVSSRLYGLSGEALLNFGLWGVAPMFALYGGLLGWYRRKLKSWAPLDARMFLAPFFTLLFVLGFICDSDTIVFLGVTEGALICVCFCAASRSLSVRVSRTRTFESLSRA